MQHNRTNPWQTLNSEIAYSNRWYAVRKDTVIRPDGSQGEYNVVEQGDSVYIVALTADQQVHLVGLYRYPTDMYSVEIPAGGNDNQDPLVAAQRELQEETGLQAATWQLLGKVQSANGCMDSLASVFLATDLTSTDHHEQAEEGITEHFTVPLMTALQMIRSGEITDSASITALSLAALHMDMLPVQ